MTIRRELKISSEEIDHTLQTAIGKLSGGISPAAVMLAYVDWFTHLILHPAKQFELLDLLQNNFWYIMKQYRGHLYGDHSGEYSVIPNPQDKRFTGKSWQQFPYSTMYESFLLIQNWWHLATQNVHGVNKHHLDVMDFIIRQFLDMLSPSNSPLTNPEVQRIANEQRGDNFIKGFKNFLEDLQRIQRNEPPVGSEKFVIGKNIAVSPGKVIYRNHLIELIQYSPLTDTVYAEPILISPAWIMKYYILDLSPKHSLVNYLVKHGHTVFMISWKNPQKEDRDLSMQDYLDLGILSALNVINAIRPRQKVHLLGYCLGGTLAAIAAATTARDSDHRLATMTILAAQTDFTEPGELGLFIDESQIAFLENIMLEKGYLDTHQIASAFQLLRSNDLIWSRVIQEYLCGQRKPLTDLMFWNADATRLPYKMHSEYLRNLFLNNQLAEGHYRVYNKPIALSDIHIPIFVVATERDHVSPWRSVFKINLLTDSNVTFVLTSGGHNVGIVSLPSKKTKRYYRISTLKESDRYIDAESWYHSTKPRNGSWWPSFEKWLAAKSSKKKIAPPSIGGNKEKFKPIIDAPGTYIFQR